jgi:hypothetical protein
VRTRVVLAVAGVLLALFGVFRLVTQVPAGDLIMLGVWLAGAIIIHDGILSPLIIGVGVLLRRAVPPRARGYLQAALIAGGLITVIALPLIYRRGSQPMSKALLEQNYFGNLTVLLGIVGATTLLAYAIHVVRFNSRTARRAQPSDREQSQRRPGKSPP